MKQDEILIGADFIKHARYLLVERYLPWARRCLESLSEEDIWWRAHKTNNSVGNLVLHLCGNVRQWIISGLGNAPDVRERPKEFAETGPIAKADLMHKLETTLKEAGRVLETFDARALQTPRTIQGFHTNGLRALFDVVSHFSEHVGQIIYITKMKTGVDLKFHNL